jgi:hypothetical protein
MTKNNLAKKLNGFFGAGVRKKIQGNQSKGVYLSRVAI